MSPHYDNFCLGSTTNFLLTLKTKSCHCYNRFILISQKFLAQFWDHWEFCDSFQNSSEKVNDKLFILSNSHQQARILDQWCQRASKSTNIWSWKNNGKSIEMLRLANAPRSLGNNVARDQLVHYYVNTLLNTFLAKPSGVPFFSFWGF